MVLEHLQPLTDADGAGAEAGVVDPIRARQWFIAHRSRSGASFIRASMTSSSPGRSRTSGFFLTLAVVSAQPALSTTGSGSAVQTRRSSSACGLFFTTWFTSQSCTLGARASRTMASRASRSNAFGRQIRRAGSIAAVSSVSHSRHASSCRVLSRSRGRAAFRGSPRDRRRASRSPRAPSVLRRGRLGHHLGHRRVGRRLCGHLGLLLVPSSVPLSVGSTDSACDGPPAHGRCPRCGERRVFGGAVRGHSSTAARATGNRRAHVADSEVRAGDDEET